MSGWTFGFVVANQVAVVVVRNLADPGSGDASAYFDAFTFFVLPHGLLAMSIATTFIPGMAAAVARRDRSIVRRPDVARPPAHRPAHAARRRVPVRAAPGHRRRLPPARRVHAGRRRQHVAGARRLRPRARRLLAVPVRPARLLRPPGHAHAVRRSTSDGPRSTSSWPSRSPPATACSDSASAATISYVRRRAVGAAGARRTRCPASRPRTVLRQPRGGPSSPARSPAR